MIILKEGAKAFLSSKEKDWKIEGCIEVDDVLDLKRFIKDGDTSFQGMLDVVAGMSKRFDRIFVNVDTFEVQGYIYPFIVTCSCSGNENKAYFTIKTCNDLKIGFDLTANFAKLGGKINDLAKFIKSVRD